MEECVKEAGLKLTRPLETDLIGPPLQESLACITGLSDSQTLAQLSEAFVVRYDSLGLSRTKPYPEIGEVLQRLHAYGFTLHLATNKRMAPTRKLIQLFGWDSWFSSIYTLDMVQPRHPNKTVMLHCQLRDLKIPLSQAIYIGDTPADGFAASANGLYFIAADWGYGNFENWDSITSWSRASQPADLLEALLHLDITR